MNNTVGVSNFIKNQIKKGGKTEIINISLNEVAKYAEKKLKKAIEMELLSLK